MGTPKPVLKYHGETFLDRISGVLAVFCDPVIVVLGHSAETIRSGVRHHERVRFLMNENYHIGQFSSMQCGLRAIGEGAPGVVYTLADHPVVGEVTLRALLADPDALIAVPRFGGHNGHPVYFHSRLMGEFLELPPDSQAKQVMRRHAPETRYVDVNDPGVLADIDDPEAYRRLKEGSL